MVLPASPGVGFPPAQADTLLARVVLPRAIMGQAQEHPGEAARHEAGEQPTPAIALKEWREVRKVPSMQG